MDVRKKYLVSYSYGYSNYATSASSSDKAVLKSTEAVITCHPIDFL
jgi:hypothetical protein